MPTYEYHCTACGKEWELFQSIKADAERVCPKCRKRTAKRKIGIGAAIFVGGKSPEPASEAANTAPQKEPTVSKKKDSSASDANPKGKKPAAAEPKAAPAAKTPEAAEPPPASKATHPAREGRGVGNLVDALARKRKLQEQLTQNRGPQGGGGKGFQGGRGQGNRPSAPRRPQGK
ncbi:MAG: zinc ribbon domain-containing protein [Phycisphaerae bacterium]|nr:zinc ribbon domain-containing protein [Phycisphaerae bacterium]